MKNSLLPFLTLALLVALTLTFSPAFGAELDLAYVKQFGYGVILASGKGLPQKAVYDAGQLDVREKAFFVPGGATATIDIRVVLPEGETYETLLAKLKKENPAGPAAEAEESVWLVWFSHDLGGAQKDQDWLATGTPETIPSGTPDVYFSTCLDENMLKWNTVGLTWTQLCSNSQIGTWLEQAKPGYRLFVAHTVGILHPPQGAPAGNATASASLPSSGNSGHNPELVLSIAPPVVKTIVTIAGQ